MPSPSESNPILAKEEQHISPTIRRKGQMCMFDSPVEVNRSNLIDLIQASQGNGTIVLSLKLQPAIDIGIGQP